MNREQWIQKRSQYDALQGAMDSYFACAREARSVAVTDTGVRTAASEPAGHAADGNKRADTASQYIVRYRA
jgi:hypothetical protein